MSDVRVQRAGPGDLLALSEVSLELEQRWYVWDRCLAGRRRVEVHPLVLGSLALFIRITAPRVGPMAR